MNRRIVMDTMLTSLILSLAISISCTLAEPVGIRGTLFSNFLKNVKPLSVKNNGVSDVIFNRRNILDNSEACTDFYSYSCDKIKSENSSSNDFKKNLNDAYSLFRAQLKKLIVEENDYNNDLISIEQQLYRSCMKLGDNHGDKDNISNSGSSSNGKWSKHTLSLDNVFDNMVKRFDLMYDKNDWQELDKKLASLGFGHAFFEISVVNDIANYGKNIILIQPPSIREWNSKKFIVLLTELYHNFQLKAYKKCQEDLKNMNLISKGNKTEEKNDAAFLESSEEPEIEIQPPSCNEFEKKDNTSIYRELLNEKDSEVINIYNYLIQIIFGSIDVTDKAPLQKKLTIKQWDKMCEDERSSKFKKASNHKIEMSWIEIIKDEFKHLDISVSEDDIILIQNYPYFKNLNIFLHTNRFFDDELIAYAVRSKFVTQNIRYYNWTWAQEINNVEKSSFCFDETKLYGISKFVLQDFSEKLSKHYKNREIDIVNNIITEFLEEISEAKDLNITEKFYLKSKLRAIVEPIMESHNVSNYYENFELTGDYFIDIINYRTMLKNKNLQNLRKLSSSHTRYTPFSFIDIDILSNRFMLQTKLGLASLAPTLSYESNYATYGVNVANFLYSLLKEDLIDSDKFDRHDSEWLIPHPTYSPKYVQCFIPEGTLKYHYDLAYKTITDIFGLRFAYQTMIKNANKTVDIREFFTAYTMMRCDSKKNKQLTKKVLSYFEELPASFKCQIPTITLEKCNLTAF